MIGRFFSRIFLALMGWKIKVNESIPKKDLNRCILIAVPHTSNWDQPLMVAAMKMLRVPFRYTIKREWLRAPLGWFIRMTGGIGIDRRPKVEGQERPSMVEAIADLFGNDAQIAIVIPPEGTRSLRTEWKMGFYYIAQKANVPICFGYLDYKTKEAGIGGVLYPTGDLDADMQQIIGFYKNISAKFPEKFAFDHRYLPKTDEAANLATSLPEEE